MLGEMMLCRDLVQCKKGREKKQALPIDVIDLANLPDLSDTSVMISSGITNIRVSTPGSDRLITKVDGPG